MAPQIVNRNDYLKVIEDDNKRFADKGFLAMYDGLHDCIVTEPGLMMIPLHDRMVHRGHSVFDTASVVNGRLWRSSCHIRRFFNSAAKARIPLAEHYDEGKLRSVLLSVAAAAGSPNCDLRYWATAGAGAFSIEPEDRHRASLYVVAIKKHLGKLENEVRSGVNDVTLSTDEVPIKPHLLATIKTTNYLLNSLMNMRAVDKGGLNGLLVHGSGRIAEGPTCGIIMLSKSGNIHTPAFDDILNSCTVRVVLRHIIAIIGMDKVAGKLNFDLKAVDGPVLYDSSSEEEDEFTRAASETVKTMVKGVEQRDISKEELYQAKELFWASGDLHLLPLNSLDGHKIGEGKPGPVGMALWSLLRYEAENSKGPDVFPVPY